MANYPQLDDQVGVWKLKDVNSAVMGGYWRVAGSRAVESTGSGTLQKLNMTSSGSAAAFGTLVSGKTEKGALGNFTRGVYTGSNGAATNIDYIEMASDGNSADFGDATAGRGMPAAFSNAIRGVTGGG